MKDNRASAAVCLTATALILTGTLTAVARSRPERFSITLPAPYSSVLDAAREVSFDGVIHGAGQYESDKDISGADAADSSGAYVPWNGTGEALYKTRPKTIAPSHFEGSRDIGTISLRYIVEPAGSGLTRVTIDAVFVEDNGHGRHLSQGMVEVAEFAEIAKRLKELRAAEAQRQAQAGTRIKTE